MYKISLRLPITCTNTLWSIMWSKYFQSIYLDVDPPVTRNDFLQRQQGEAPQTASESSVLTSSDAKTVTASVICKRQRSYGLRVAHT
jgi:hypothetical protein